MSEAAHVLAIDLGTSAAKVALVATDGRVVAGASKETELHLSPGGGAEQDPAQWWAGIVEAATRVLDARHVAIDSIAAVACTAQWSGTVAVDASGEPLRPAIIWMDARGAPHVQRLTAGWPSVSGYGAAKLARWVRRTGGAPGHTGKDPIAHILYLKHEEPEVYRAAGLFLEPKDYLNLRLTGQAAATFDSIALHWVTDNRRPGEVRYDPGLLAMSGVDPGKLPPLRRAIDVLGPLRPEAAADLGLPPGIPVVAGTPDVHSAAIGSGATRDLQAHLYVGTSSWLTCHVPFKKTDLRHNMASLPSAIPGRYLVANEQETAGACLTFLRDRVLYEDGPAFAEARAGAYAEFDRLARAAAPGARGLIFTPWLYGERTPVENPHVRGGFHNLSLDATRADLVRAVFEGVAFNARWLLGAVERFVGRRLDPIRFIGGGARSEVWAGIFADVLDRTIERVADPVDANARGAGILGAVALGRMAFEDAADAVTLAAVHRPEPANRATYDELFAEFRGYYRRNRKAHARLNGRTAG